MSDVPGRKPFTTTETHFLEAGVEMDLAAQAEVARMGVENLAPAPESRWSLLAGAARGRWGALVAVAAGGLLLGGLASSRAPEATLPPAVLAVQATAEAPPPLDLAPSLVVSEAAAGAMPAADAVAAVAVVAEVAELAAVAEPVPDRPRKVQRKARLRPSAHHRR